jgi:predicted transcriptional regulator of viral defense system
MSHAVLTGPIKGTVTLADGTAVDVKPDVVYVDTPEQAAEVADLIGKRYEVEGHPAHDFGDTFTYTAPTEV